MPHLGHHIRIRLLDDRVVAPTVAQRRLVARVVLHHGLRYNLVAMALADSHLHMEAMCDRNAAGRFAHGIEASLKQRLRLEVSFIQYVPEPIQNPRHLRALIKITSPSGTRSIPAVYVARRLHIPDMRPSGALPAERLGPQLDEFILTRVLRNAFKYILTQHKRHGLRADLVFEASNVPDLLGLRLQGRYTLRNVRRWLPRVRRSELLQWLSMPEIESADGPLESLEAATLAASCLDNLQGSSRAVVTARRAMIEILGSRVANPDMAKLLGVAPRTLRRLRSRDAEPDLVKAIRLQLGYRQSLIPSGTGIVDSAISSDFDLL